MASAQEKELLTSGGSIISHLHERQGNISDDSVSSGDGTHFKNRMGLFDLVFPETPKVPKGKLKQSKPMHHSSQCAGVSATLMESDAGLEVDIRHVVATNYLPEAIFTHEDTNGQVGTANNTQINSQDGMYCITKCNILLTENIN